MLNALTRRAGLMTRSFSCGCASKHYDMLTLGGGSGGLFTALKAKGYGKNVAVIDRHKLGGRCVHAGCIPKKIIYHAASIKEDMECGPDYGVTFDNMKVSWLKIKDVRDKYTHSMHLGYLKDCQNAGVEFINASARFVGPHELEIKDPHTGDTSRLTADHIVVATGSRPLMPKNIKGIDLCLNTDSFFNLEKLPKSMFVIGGGYIGTEIACALNTVGIKTTICMLEDHLVTPFDHDITDCLADYMRSCGVEIMPHAAVKKIEKTHNGLFSVACEGYEPKTAEAVLCAAGIRPNTDGIGLEDLGIKMGRAGNIIVDDYENTSLPGIYAIGDATGKVILTPVAKTAGSRLATRLFGGDPSSKLDYSIIPSVAFTHPPMGKVGMTEEQAKATYGEKHVKVYKQKFTQLFYEVTKHKQPTLIKLVCKLPEERVIGVHAIGRGVDEMIQGYSVALTAGATKMDYDNTLAIHPTTSEAFVAL